MSALADRAGHEAAAPPVERGEATSRTLRADHGCFRCCPRVAHVGHDDRQRVEASHHRLSKNDAAADTHSARLEQTSAGAMSMDARAQIRTCRLTIVDMEVATAIEAKAA